MLQLIYMFSVVCILFIVCGKFLFVALSLAVAASAPQANVTEKPAIASVIDPSIDPNDLSCDPHGQIFLLLPHFTNCHKFYMCAHGEEVEFTCAANLIFDFYLQTCNWDWAVECILRTPDDIEGSGDEVNDNMIGLFGDVLENQAVDTVASVRPISPIMSRYTGVLNCNRPDEASRQISYKGDCQRFWRCKAGIPQVEYCTDGLFFNESTQQCDYEANSKCNAVLPEDELQSEFIVYNK